MPEEPEVLASLALLDFVPSCESSAKVSMPGVYGHSHDFLSPPERVSVASYGQE